MMAFQTTVPLIFFFLGLYITYIIRNHMVGESIQSINRNMCHGQLALIVLRHMDLDLTWSSWMRKLVLIKSQYMAYTQKHVRVYSCGWDLFLDHGSSYSDTLKLHTFLSIHSPLNSYKWSCCFRNIWNWPQLVSSVHFRGKNSVEFSSAASVRLLHLKYQINQLI